ncbi:MAG: glycosyltransferase family 39 protein [Nitrospirae bacterium]|nr:glycosyltransferase family 39 protein [Nitrospirota bacterium]
MVTVLLIFCIIFSAEAILSMKEESPTIDEPMHLTKGYAQLRYGDFSMEPQNPPLVTMLSALPLLFMDLNFPEELIGARGKADDYEIADQFFYYRGNDADTLLFWGRLPVVLLGVLLGFYVFRWSYEIYGLRGSLLSLMLYSFSPVILANTKLITTDVGVTCFIFISMYYFFKYLKQPSFKGVLKTGVFVGLALSSKVTALFLFPVLLLTAAFYRQQTTGFNKKKMYGFVRDFAITGFIGVFILWSFYFFKVETVSTLYDVGSDSAKIQKVAGRLHLSPDILVTAASFIPSPGTYLKGLGNVISDAGRSQPLFFMGERSERGWRSYHIVAFLMKTPVPALALLLMSSAFFFSYSTETKLSMMVAVFFLLQSVIGGVADKGLRHILPMYPFMFVFTAGVTTVKKYPKIMNAAAGLLMLWYVISSVNAFPDYIPYYNEFAGGPGNGYKYFIDSNTDWGQDLKKLKKYMDEKKIDRVKLAYFGTASPDYYGINYEYLWSHNRIKKPDDFKGTTLPGKGIYAVSATSLQLTGYWDGEKFDTNSEYSYKWLSRHEPVDIVGNSILIYDVR